MGLREWVPVAEQELAPAWSTAVHMKFSCMVPIPPGCARCIYIRASRPLRPRWPNTDAAGIDDVAPAGQGAAPSPATVQYPFVGSRSCHVARLLGISRTFSLVDDGKLAIIGSGMHLSSGHHLLGELHGDLGRRDYTRNERIGTIVPDGGLSYFSLGDPKGSAAREVDMAIMAAEAKLRERLSSLCGLLPSMHAANHALVMEWNADADASAPADDSSQEPRPPARDALGLHAFKGSERTPEPFLPLLLPPFETLPSPTQPPDGEVVRLCCGDDVTRRLWLRWLRTHDASGQLVALAQLLRALRQVRRCARGSASQSLLLRPYLRAISQRSAQTGLVLLALSESAMTPIRALLASEGGGDSASSARREDNMRRVEAVSLSILQTGLADYRASQEGELSAQLASMEARPVFGNSFTLIRRIGRGSFGEVFAARKEDTTALFALKFVHKKRLSTRSAAAHLGMERRTLEKLVGCPFLCGLRYAFQQGPWYVLTFPLLPGGTLQILLDERTTPSSGLPYTEVRWIGAQLLLALAHMHDQDIMHRDIKPSNVMLRRDGYLVLCDFGLAANLSEGTPSSKSGTRGYWAPECILRQPQGMAADWWSFGCVLWYAWNGRHPFHQRWVQRPVGGVSSQLPQPIPEALFTDAVSHTTAGASGEAKGGASNFSTVRVSGLPETALDYNTLHLPLELLSLHFDEPPPPPPSSQRRITKLHKLVSWASLGIVLGGESAEPPIVSEVSTTGLAAAASERGEVVPGMSVLAVNGKTVRGHEAGSRALAQAEGDVELELLDPSNLSREIVLKAHETEKALVQLLRGLLTRDASARLATHQAVRAQPLFSEMDWPLLEAQLLPAPFTPDPQVVYVKDRVAPLSNDGAKKKKLSNSPVSPNEAKRRSPTSAAAMDVDGEGDAHVRPPEEFDNTLSIDHWQYVSDPSAYANELDEWVRKASTDQLSRQAQRAVAGHKRRRSWSHLPSLRGGASVSTPLTVRNQISL